jgi:hypothetical protein
MVKAGGTLSVTETVTFKFVGGPFTYVFRDIPTDKTDGIVIESASMDDQIMQHGSGTGQVEITYGNPVKVTWHFVCLLFGVPTGTWPGLFLPLGVVGISITVAVLGGIFTTLSEKGVQAAARWKAFSHYL